MDHRLALPLLAFSDADHWEPGIGDPTFMGWLTVVAYFATALLCWRVALRIGRQPVNFPQRRKQLIFWFTFAVFLAVLGVNKQLDLQTWFTLFARHLALAEGWYERRRAVQVVFILLVGLSSLAGVAGLAWLTRRSIRQHGFALAGGVFLACFILIRAASFHHVDQLLGTEFGGLRMNWILELGGILWVAVGAWRQKQPASTPLDGTRGEGFVLAPHPPWRSGDSR